jgi:phosphoserine phosphatase
MASSNSEKADRVREYAREQELSLDDCLAFGDSVADIPMLEAVRVVSLGFSACFQKQNSC